MGVSALFIDTGRKTYNQSTSAQQAVRRQIQRFCQLLEAGDGIPEDQRPTAPTLADRIRHCRSTGPHAPAKLLYGRGGEPTNLQMNPSQQSYNQPEKNLVRERIISASVKALSGERASSPVVSVDVFHNTVDYAARFLADNCDIHLDDDLKPHVEGWLDLHGSRVGTKKPNELQVLLLAGSEPLNDLMSFRKFGIAFENIWVVESDKKTFATAVKATEKEGIRIKLHRGSLKSFFEIVPQQFDIVYFDAMDPLFGGDPNTIHVIRELVFKQRLAPLSVLVTNFREVDKDGKAGETWGKRLGIWAYAHGTMDTWTQHIFPSLWPTR